MQSAKISIEKKDRKVGAMVKALAVEVSGFEAVKGTTKEFLITHGYYEFHFPSLAKVNEFKEAVEKYVPSTLAKVVPLDH